MRALEFFNRLVETCPSRLSNPGQKSLFEDWPSVEKRVYLTPAQATFLTDLLFKEGYIKNVKVKKPWQPTELRFAFASGREHTLYGPSPKNNRYTLLITLKDL